MAENRILWIDDEIEFLKPHILFLTEKGYEVTPVVSGSDAIDILRESPGRWDLILIDENMPGLTGLETLDRLRVVAPDVPVVMITKSEEENLMDQAVGSQIKDYLIKPVNPNQILLTIKKLLHADRLVSRQASANYPKEFVDLSAMIDGASDFSQWAEIYRRLTLRAIALSESAPEIAQLLASQHDEAQKAFFRFVRKRYAGWTGSEPSEVEMSNHILRRHVVPSLREGRKTVLMVMDNFRLDQWMTVRPLFAERFEAVDEHLYCSLLPTATQYARNALFSGLLPRQIEKRFPDLWIDEDDERSKNLNEEPLVANLLKECGLTDVRLSFFKANNSSQLNNVIKTFDSRSDGGLTVIVVNFIDILSHAKTDSQMVRELASTDAAYRSLTLSWFRHSPFLELIDKIASSKADFFFTTDHGTIRVDRPIRIVAEKSANTALRYKLGQRLSYPGKEVYAITDPMSVGLPAPALSTTYIFAGENNFFAYNSNYNHYVRHFTDTYQHGGISFEEMILPFAKLRPRQ